jgi:metallophosphoesterase (TIGR00282 family)
LYLQGKKLKEKINILFIGDIVGEPGIKAVNDFLPIFKEKYKPDCIIANGENADKGNGITKNEAGILIDLGIHIITTGNHVWDNWHSKPLLATNPQVLRPLNYPPGNFGRGYAFLKLSDGTEIAVLNLQGRTYMQIIDCPFRSADHALKSISERTNIVFVDFHADATAEKQAMAHYLNGRVSALIGSHTHIPTADYCILSKGTAYITDVGMTGPFDSIVGMDTEQALKRFLLQIPHKYEVAKNDIRICGVNITVDVASGKAECIEQFMYPEPKRKENT